jgi:hypothetical protein
MLLRIAQQSEEVQKCDWHQGGVMFAYPFLFERDGSLKHMQHSAKHQQDGVSCCSALDCKRASS